MIGTWVKLPTVEVVEILAVAGLDFVIIDLEHGAISMETASQMIGAAHAAGMRPLVRVPAASAAFVQPVLDAGAAGIVVPHVEDPGSARDAVRAVRFPPLGERGASPSGRAGGWGTVPLDAYLAAAEAILVVAQVESMTALAAIEEIGSVPGIDLVFIGEVDLAASSGLALDGTSLRGQVDAAVETCRRAGLVLGGGARNGAEAASKLASGYGLVTVSTDLGLLRSAAAEVAAAVGQAPSEEIASVVPASSDSRLRDELLALVTAVWFEIDRTDGKSVSRYFTDDATLAIARSRAVGTGEIDDLYANRQARGPRVSRHCVTNLHVVEAGASSVRASSTLLLFAEDGEAPLTRMAPALVADVEDTFVHREGRWLIQSRHIKPQFLPEEGGLAVPTE
jgi:2-keto-3-deoxy-L-rhamnonate aldolase RhmA